METRNKGRAPGVTVLGVPMPQLLKDRIKQAADLDRRTMADWSRLELEKAANAVISAASEQSAPMGNVLLNPLPSAKHKKNGKTG